MILSRSLFCSLRSNGPWVKNVFCDCFFLYLLHRILLFIRVHYECNIGGNVMISFNAVAARIVLVVDVYIHARPKELKRSNARGHIPALPTPDLVPQGVVDCQIMVCPQEQSTNRVYSVRNTKRGALHDTFVRDDVRVKRFNFKRPCFMRKTQRAGNNNREIDKRRVGRISNDLNVSGVSRRTPSIVFFRYPGCRGARF